MNNKQKVISILMALTLGGVAGHHMDDIVEKYNLQVDRYPIEVEYEIIYKCISNYEKPLARRIYLQKKEICTCALGKTELDYSYSSYQKDYDVFLNIFEVKANECMSTMR
ncbi:hypothetical protein [Aliarcobacter butzleri]|uniref:hypothetical protein n=1 Tax=Aliarcobacter butzleri TaxID=28197 RepID=UPI00062E4E62|nr:hypothetical protein [Aliarcobacter butzleri]KLD98293.1 hypothetical protein AF74_03485 [Aliarcobacter butzleri L349]